VEQKKRRMIKRHLTRWEGGEVNEKNTGGERKRNLVADCVRAKKTNKTRKKRERDKKEPEAITKEGGSTRDSIVSLTGEEGKIKNAWEWGRRYISQKEPHSENGGGAGGKGGKGEEKSWGVRHSVVKRGGDRPVRADHLKGANK